MTASNQEAQAPRSDGDTMTGEEYQAHLAKTRFKNEAAFQHWLKEAAAENGWLYQHNSDSRRSDASFPDTVMVRNGRLIFAELKTEKKWSKVTKGQQRWLDALSQVQDEIERILWTLTTMGRCPLEVYVWRPRDVDRILEILQ